VPFSPTIPRFLTAAPAAILLIVLSPSCGPEPDTSTLDECNQSSDCQAGESCCEGLCVPVGTACGAEPDTDATTQPDIDTTTQPDTDATTHPNTDATNQPDTDATTQPETDVVCTPACDGKQCGDNGCGGTCGACDDGWNCVRGTCEPGGPLPALWDTGVWDQSRWAP